MTYVRHAAAGLILVAICGSTASANPIPISLQPAVAAPNFSPIVLAPELVALPAEAFLTPPPFDPVEVWFSGGADVSMSVITMPFVLVAAVPEPCASALLATGLFGLGLATCRRKRSFR